ncbi:DUF1642 domain-containing protein [Companilactobacillus crustorum]|uniref:DUF1642 domain-containing protein n=1 Tax=Companilactobacillus crustorum TaxID=392416 RepID=UPI00237E34B9|nr:DUF1642 domain-containing protein [Companilactobacillus crustorum]WDT66086.1 DUF1642 domain-containing protein [Companilactobacillus crustorum]
MMDDVRILKDWTKDERKELEEAEDNGFLSAMALIRGICDDVGYCHALSKKYYREDTNDNNQMAKDIVDFYCGNAKFPEQKYYVKIPKIGFPYLVQADDGMELVRYLRSGYKEEFTEQEIKDIDPRYMVFAVPVEK